MLRPGKGQIFVLLVAILVAATLPVPASCEMTAHPDAARCGGADTDAQSGSSHCGPGCTDCSLPCCVGTAVILAAVPNLVAIAPIVASPRPECLVRPQVDTAPLGRPPQS